MKTTRIIIILFWYIDEHICSNLIQGFIFIYKVPKFSSLFITITTHDIKHNVMKIVVGREWDNDMCEFPWLLWFSVIIIMKFLQL